MQDAGSSPARATLFALIIHSWENYLLINKYLLFYKFICNKLACDRKWISNMYLKASDWVKMSIFYIIQMQGILCISSMLHWHDAISTSPFRKGAIFQLVAPIHSLLYIYKDL